MTPVFRLHRTVAERSVLLLIAIAVTVTAIPLAQITRASAAQFTNRSIKLSDASPSGTTITSGVGSGTNVTYEVAFTPASAAKSMVIDFCKEDPVINDTCTAPTGMTAATGVSGVSGTAGGTGWTLTATANQVKIANSGGIAANDIVGGTAQVFDLTGITNTSSVGTFYARMYTYSNATYGTYVGPTNVGAPVDFGGIALAITNTITITARVQEKLDFCVTTANPTGTPAWNVCTDATVAANPPNLILGHGTPTPILDNTAVDTGTIYSQITTNATNGAAVRLRNSNLSCGGLSSDGGTTCAIPAIGATASAMTAGTANFGLFVSNGSPNTGGSGTVSAAATYNDGTHINTTSGYYYGMDNTTAGNNVTSTYGSVLATASAPLYKMINTYIFGATASLTTPAGLYQANLSMIATGKF